MRRNWFRQRTPLEWDSWTSHHFTVSSLVLLIRKIIDSVLYVMYLRLYDNVWSQVTRYGKGDENGKGASVVEKVIKRILDKCGESGGIQSLDRSPPLPLFLKFCDGLAFIISNNTESSHLWTKPAMGKWIEKKWGPLTGNDMTDIWIPFNYGTVYLSMYFAAQERNSGFRTEIEFQRSRCPLRKFWSRAYMYKHFLYM